MKLLATIETIKAECHIEGNVEGKKLRPAILDAQRIHVQNVLGTRLFEHFLNSIDEDGSATGLTATQQTCLEEYVMPMLAKFTEAEYTVQGNFHRSNIGTVQAGSDRVDRQRATDLESMKYIHDGIMNKAEALAKRCVNYIIHEDNKVDLGDLFYDCDQNLTPSPSTFVSPIYLGER